MIQDLLDFMARHKLNQRACARVLGQSPFQVNRWLNGKTKPNKTTADYVKMKMEEFEIKLLTLRNKQDTL